MLSRRGSCVAFFLESLSSLFVLQVEEKFRFPSSSCQISLGITIKNWNIDNQLLSYKETLTISFFTIRQSWKGNFGDKSNRVGANGLQL